MQAIGEREGSPDVAIRADKVLTTPADLSVGVMQGLEKALNGALREAVAAWLPILSQL